MKSVYFSGFAVLCLFIASVQSCKNDKGDSIDGVPVTVGNSGYPEDVGAIIINRCATAGCHNTQSKEGASGLDLTTWDHMFEGNHSGAVTIPYRADASPLFTFCNIYSDLGDTTQLPKMPVGTSS